MNKRITRNNKKIIKKTKRTLKRKNKTHIGSGPNTEFQQQVALRDTFRKMFKSLFTIIYNSQNKNDAVAYEKGITDFLNALKRHKTSINTLIPVTNNYMPIDKKTYSSSDTPLMGFVPFMSILIYNINNEKDLLRILIQFKRSSGNINLMSIKDEVSALSTATDAGKVDTMTELLKRGADINLLPETGKTKLLGLIPNALEHKEIQPEPVVQQPTVTETEPPVTETEPPISTRQITLLTLPYAMPESSGYPTDNIPEFWAPIFNNTNNELLELREKILTILTNDNSIKMENNIMSDTWTICKMVQTMIPRYYVPNKNAPYMQGDTFYKDLDEDFMHYNMMLCACLIIFGILSNKMVGQKYDLIFKGGKAIQLVLGQIQNTDQYISEDIDILVKPKDGVEYNKAEIKSLALHIGHLAKWFLSSSELKTNISVLDPDASDNIKRNPNIVKISYIKSTKRYDYKKAKQVDEYKPLSDIEFKELPVEIVPFFSQVIKYSFYIEELDTNVLFVCPNIGAIIDEKLYFYVKYTSYKLRLEKGEKITDAGYETVTLSDCDFYMNKFAKAILALSFGLEQSRNPEMSKDLLLDKQRKFIKRKLDNQSISDTLKTDVYNSLFV
jgi:hypothetical protein